MINDKWAILRERAKEQSLKELVQASVDEPVLEVIEFILNGERYALEMEHVREVLAIKHCTLLPCVPAFILGLISVRRKVLSLIDLGFFFELTRTVDFHGKYAIVLEGEGQEFAIVADEISKVVTFPCKSIQPPLPSMAQAHQELIRGITCSGLVVLDGWKLLNFPALIIDEEPSNG